MKRLGWCTSVTAFQMLSFSSGAMGQIQQQDWFPGTSSIDEAEIVPQGYRGTWAPSAEVCSDAYSAERIHIGPAGVDGYESGGRLERITQAGQERSVRVKLAYEGEGQFWDAEETWTLSEKGDRLAVSVETSSDPILYVRCN